MLRLILKVLLAPLWLPLHGVRAVLRRFFPVTVLRFDLVGSLPDHAVRRGPLALLGNRGVVTLPTLLRALTEAEGDPALACVVLRIKELSCGLARAEDVRRALVRLKHAGTHVTVFSEEYSTAAYWVALGASEVVLAPSGHFSALGFASEFTLLKGFLDKVGLRAQLTARGKYKSMRETFTEEHISDANREMLEALLWDLKAQYFSLVEQARGLSQEQLEQILDSGPHRAEPAKSLGLVDELLYFDEVKDRVEERFGKRGVELGGYLKRRRQASIAWRRPVSVALLNVTGSIKSGSDRLGRGGKQATGSDSFCRAVRRARDNPRIKAVVLRIDSPGGSALASDIMWRELSRLAEEKPVVVSMVNVAASGGYYVAGLKGVEVWASPTTLTGSIGVVGGKFAVEGLLSKLGIGRAQVSTGARAAYYSGTKAWSAEELQKLEEDIDASYQEFVSKMAEARETDFETLHSVAQGRVWTGQQAEATVLVDHLGGFSEVTEAVRSKLSLKPKQQLAWMVMDLAGAGGLFPEPDEDWQARLPAPVAALSEEWLGPMQDYQGERLLALSPVRIKF